MFIIINLLSTYFSKSVPPGEPRISTNHTWLENRTYTALCISEAGRPESSYRWAQNGVAFKDEHLNQIRIDARMDLDGTILRCNVSNNYTIEKNKPKYDTKSLIVECKFQYTCCAQVFLTRNIKKSSMLIKIHSFRQTPS